jgi:Mg-chelatase subunit ChlD
VIDGARRRSVPRRALASSALFARMSPGVGSLDDRAVARAIGDDPDEALTLLATLTSATDERLRAHARRLAAQIFVDLTASGSRRLRGTAQLASVAYRPGIGDIDVDASLDALVDARASGAVVDVDRLRVQAWTTPATTWCLLVDHSGSMAGRSLATAGMAAAAIAGRAAPEQVAVLSFARSVVAVTTLAERHDPGVVVDRVLALRGHGTTDLAAALRAAAGQLSAARAGRRITVLLSDCRQTEPGDAVAAAAGLDELVIVAPHGDSDEAAQLASSAGGRWTAVAAPSQIPSALADVLGRTP